MNATETPPSETVEKEKPAGHDGHQRHAQPLDAESMPKDLHKPSSVTVIVIVVLFLALLAGLFVVGWLPHERMEKQTAADANDAKASNTPVVSVAHPRPEKTEKDVVLPCTILPNQQTAIYTRAVGFIKQWFLDIGDHAKKGQLLAVIDAPDIDAQYIEAKATLAQSKASVLKANADLLEAQSDYQRYLSAQKENPGSVTQQDLDVKRNAYADAAAGVEVAKANVVQNEAEVERLAVLQGFDQVTAPFDGTITARNYDVGAYINPSNTNAGTEMFNIADTKTLRVNVNVPQTYATDIRIGQAAYLAVRNYPHRRFQGVVARQTGALDAATRTLLFQLDFPNPDGTLDVGMYGNAALPISQAQPVLVVSSSALIFNADGVQVAVVRDGKVHFQKITVGRDLGTELEVTDGLSADDDVIVNPGERLAEGGDVQVSEPTASTKSGN